MILNAYGTTGHDNMGIVVPQHLYVHWWISLLNNALDTSHGLIEDLNQLSDSELWKHLAMYFSTIEMRWCTVTDVVFIYTFCWDDHDDIVFPWSKAYCTILYTCF